MNDIQRLFVDASDRFGVLVHQVGPGQWANATPCTEWDVRALVSHLVNECAWVPPLLSGETIEGVGDRFDGDLLGEDPAGAWEARAKAAIDAVRQPGAMDRTVHLSFGDTPGSEYVQQVFTDLAIHAWDLARGIGANDTIDPTVVQLLYAQVAPQEEEMRSYRIFGDTVVPPDGASAQTKLLAIFGRVQ